MNDFLARWRRAVQRRDNLAAQGGQPTEEDSTTTTTGLTIAEIADRMREVLLPAMVPAGMVLDDSTKVVIDDALHDLVVRVEVAIIGQSEA